MKVLDEHTKFAHLGKPGEVFSEGFKRRLDMVASKVDLLNKVILDLGCGEGVWLAQFARYTNPHNVYGSEYDPEQVEMLHKNPIKVKYIGNEMQIPNENIRLCPGEKLDFKDNFFDVVFQNEVLEHVQDDVQVLRESFRVLDQGGKLVFFTPNRGWPFETHGMFLGGKYYWGNIPLLPWMPKFIYKKFAPHVKNYSNGELERKIKEAGGKVIYHTHIFPGFDGLKRRFGLPGRMVADFFVFLEKTPLHFFGISHFIIAEKAS